MTACSKWFYFQYLEWEDCDCGAGTGDACTDECDCKGGAGSETQEG